jgi:hypothetical protein
MTQTLPSRQAHASGCRVTQRFVSMMHTDGIRRDSVRNGALL